MEFLLGLIGLSVLLGVPIVAIVALVRSLGLAGELRRVEARLAALERAVPAATAAAEPAPIAPTPTTDAETVAQAPAPEPAEPAVSSAPSPHALPAPVAPARPVMSFEERLGT
ncbi:MAG TPA: hypothetical protein VH600_14340 [Burkholderiales bacterium]|jgi:hypothetical protein